MAAGDELGGDRRGADAGGASARAPRSAPSPRRRRDAIADAVVARAPRRADPAAPPRRPRRASSLYPFVASPFFTYQIGAQSLALGLIALSLTFLGGYGGMVSLAQMTVAGRRRLPGRDLRHQQHGERSASAGRGGSRCRFALLGATVFAAAVGWLSVRTEGIYTIMITLAIGVAFFYLAQQNYTVFNGFQGLSKIAAPELVGIDFREPVPFYFVALGCALGRLLPRQAPGARAVRRRPAGHPRQPAPDGRRSATTSPRTASPRTPSPACSPRSAAC